MAYKLVGNELLKNPNEKVENVEEALKGKVACFYFSAHWCPPCRAFSPQFYQVYNTIKASDKGDKLEVIFVSSDQDLDSFNNYYSHHPWLAIPYDKLRQVGSELSTRFGIRGIPSVIVVNENGDVITKDGRRDVMMHKEQCIDQWLN